MSAVIERVIADAKVIVCVGSGGVGKTTTAAVVAMQAAMMGRRTLVMTVDPARRLANALGLTGLDEDIQRIDLSALGYNGPGELHATMLDMKRALDEIVERHAPDIATRNAILENQFYHYFSTSLAGAQELSAGERLYHEAASGRWELIVLDTPPTANALDFLDAPIRFHEALDSAALQWLMETSGQAARKGGSWLNVGTQFMTRVLGRFTGMEFFQELSGFLVHFS
ncbi:MAG: AAA family ATPase, partial [Myxococcales bacterium]|nr:AAA family ATPase [Myxococcales bacterium]